MTLNIAPTVQLPDQFVTETCAILARRGAGKTYTAKVLAEEIVASGGQVCIIDVLGVLWGLRADAKGRPGGGLPFTILGGDHGDLPITRTSGKVIADVVATSSTSFIIDISAFETKAARVQFVTDFAKQLYAAKRKQPSPLMLIVDEADELIPQSHRGDVAEQVGAWEAIVRRGRVRGLGCTLVTQRPAVLNKNVLTQCGSIILMRITGPQDRDAAGEWVKGNASKAETAAVLDTLASLERGEGWIWAPEWDLLERIRVRRSRTFDSTRTPEPGETPIAATLAPVDLDQLAGRLVAVEREAAESDPKHLRARVRELERELAKAQKARPEPVEVEVVREVETVPAAVIAAVDQLVAAMGARPIERVSRTEPVRNVEPRRTMSAVPSPDGVKIGRAERAVLSVAAQFPAGRTVKQIAMMTGYSPKASTIGVALSKLRQAGYIGPGNNPVRITPEGAAWLGDSLEPLPTGSALLDFWRSHHLDKAARAVLDLMVDAYPIPLTHDEIADKTGYSREASTIGVALSKLRKLELVDGFRLADDFHEAIAA